MKRALAPLAVVLALAAPAASGVDPVQTHALQNRDWEARCSLTGRIFHRLAEQRVGGADQRTAVFSVTKWVEQLGDTGSRFRFNYAEAVQVAGGFVYQHRELQAETLAHFGYRSCAMQYHFPGDEPRVQAGQMLLLPAVNACQKSFPGEKNNGMLRDCIRDQSADIVTRVKTAKIQIEK